MQEGMSADEFFERNGEPVQGATTIEDPADAFWRHAREEHGDELAA